MTKPLFLICPGIAKCGTTMLHRLLRDYNTYIHSGDRRERSKETHYLTVCYLNRVKTGNTKKLYNYWKSEHLDNPLRSLYFPPSITNLTEKLSDKLYDEWYSEEYRLETYLKFYLELYEVVKPVYHGVGEFSTTLDIHVSKEFIQEVDQLLSEHFDVKVVMMFRDPVERLFSHLHMIKKLFYQGNNPDFASQSFDCWIAMEENQTLYPTAYDLWKSVFGDRVLACNMDLFNPDKSEQRETLSKFLNLPPIDISNTKPANKQVYEENLTIDQIIEGKILLKPNYDFYNSMFGIK